MELFIKSLRRWFARVGLKFCSLIIIFLPKSLLYSFAKVIATIGYYLAAKQRRIALESLTIAFGKEKSYAQIKQIAKQHVEYMAKSALEVLFFIQKPFLIKEAVEIEGKDYLDKALSKGKGVILVSAHFGNFPLMLTRFPKEGYPVNIVARRMRDEKMEVYFQGRRDALGMKTIHTQPRRDCVESCLKVLRNGELLFLQADQNFGSGKGIFVDFFGRKAATATGPIVFALRTGAALLPVFIVRQENNTHKIIIEPEIILKELADYNSTVQVNLQSLTGIIETYIRKYPTEWGWIHRRWKNQPSSDNTEQPKRNDFDISDVLNSGQEKEGCRSG